MFWAVGRKARRKAPKARRKQSLAEPCATHIPAYIAGARPHPGTRSARVTAAEPDAEAPNLMSLGPGYTVNKKARRWNTRAERIASTKMCL